ncbi:MAG TPA: VOC family protein [Nevskia sp.]|nr:VOC family protein [Nevskia sp.]
MKIDAYLSFEGRCDEAIAFYRKALGAEVAMLMRFKEAPPEVVSQMAPGSLDKVMHAALSIGDSTVMMSDGYCTGKSVFQGISLSLTVKDEAEAKRRYEALAEGGNASLPLHQTFFARSFGMVTDRLGIQWMVIAPVQA